MNGLLHNRDNEQEAQVQDLTSLLVAASTLRAKWVVSLKNESTNSSPREKRSPGPPQMEGIPSGPDKSGMEQTNRNEHTTKFPEQMRVIGELQTKTHESDYRQTAATSKSFIFEEFSKERGEKAKSPHADVPTKAVKSSSPDYTSGLAPIRSSNIKDEKSIVEKLRNTEACLFKAQSELIQLRESNRFAKAKLCVDFENRLIIERAAWKQDQAILEDDLRIARAETVRLHEALAAAKNETLMIEVRASQKALDHQGRGIVVPTNRIQSIALFDDKVSSPMRLRDSFSDSEGCLPEKQERSISEIQAFEEVAQLRNDLEIAHETARSADHEISKLRSEINRLSTRNQELMTSLQNAEIQLKQEIQRAEAAERTQLRAVVPIPSGGNDNSGSQKYCTKDLEVDTIPQFPSEIQSSILHELVALERLVADTQHERALSTKRNVSCDIAVSENILSALEVKVQRMKNYVATLIQALAQKVETPIAQIQAESSWRGINTALSEQHRKFALLEAEYEAYKMSISKQVAGLSHVNSELHRDLSYQVSKERMEKEMISGMFDEAKLRIKDLECELVILISKVQESHRTNHEDYIQAETLRKKCNAFVKENSRLEVDVLRLERALASSESQPPSFNLASEQIYPLSPFPQTGKSVADHQQEVTKLTNHFVAESNTLTVLLLDRENQIRNLQEILLDRENRIIALEEELGKSQSSFGTKAIEDSPISNGDHEQQYSSPFVAEPRSTLLCTRRTHEALQESNQIPENITETIQELASPDSSDTAFSRESFEHLCTSTVVFPGRGELPNNETLANYSGDCTSDGCPHGRGIQIWSDGRIYDGLWHNGAFTGSGTCVWMNGDIYEGNEFSFSYLPLARRIVDDNVYELGDWLDGHAKGLGSYTFSSGNFYEGEFDCDKFHGVGALHHRNGWRCRGEWREGRMDGWNMVMSLSGNKKMIYCRAGAPCSDHDRDAHEAGQMLLLVGEVIAAARTKRESLAHKHKRRTDVATLGLSVNADTLHKTRVASPAWPGEASGSVQEQASRHPDSGQGRNARGVSEVM